MIRMKVLPLLILLWSCWFFTSVEAWTTLPPMMAVASASPTQQEPRRIQPPPANVRLLILPGFGNDAKDYYLERAPQGSLVQSLQRRGWTDEQIRVLPVQRTDWIQVFLKGLCDPQFWQANAAPTRPAFAWYLNRVAEQVHELTSDDSNSKVVLVCHSAGGWLGRAALGFLGKNSSVTKEEEENDDETSSALSSSSPSSSSIHLDLDRVLGLVTLGAPHTPPPLGAMDMTRGALRITHEQFPGAWHNGLFYLTIMGEAITGVQQKRQSFWEPTTASGFAYSSYEAVCGNGTTVGDGVVPIEAGHLPPPAVQITLEDILHSINAPDQWYGSDAVLDSWHDELLEQIRAKNGK